MQSILIVEDDITLAKGIRLALQNTSLQITLCHTLAETQVVLNRERFDLIILDINLPDGSGLELLKEARKVSTVPIILLTANDMEMDIVTGLESGADDYITKPFSLAILRARVNAQLRRSTPAKSSCLEIDEFQFDFDRMEFRKKGQLIELSKTEQKLLRMSINSSYEMHTFRRVGGYCHGTFKEVTEEQIENLSAHSNVKAAGKRITIGYMDSGIFAKAPAEVSFMDDNCTEWSFAEPTTGHKPQVRNEITMDTHALKLLGVEPEVGAEIELTYTVGALSEMPYEKTDTFTLAGWWEYDDLSPVHYINISEEYAKEIEAEAMSKGLECVCQLETA